MPSSSASDPKLFPPWHVSQYVHELLKFTVLSSVDSLFHIPCISYFVTCQRMAGSNFLLVFLNLDSTCHLFSCPHLLPGLLQWTLIGPLASGIFPTQPFSTQSPGWSSRNTTDHVNPLYRLPPIYRIEPKLYGRTGKAHHTPGPTYRQNTHWTTTVS